MDMDSTVSGSKRPRVFVAKQACDNCRSKKTRCDEDFPCSQCASIGAECKYGDRKATRKEESFSTLFSYLSRIEAKVDKLAVAKPHSVKSPSVEPLEDSWGASAASSRSAHVASTDRAETVSPECHHRPETLMSSPRPRDERSNSFSTRRTIFSPPLWSRLPKEIVSMLNDGTVDYATSYEMGRTPQALAATAGTELPSLLATTNTSIIRDLCLAYFATFNLLYPVLDRDYFLRHTFPSAMIKGFDEGIESCVVLVVMALGCWGRSALQEAGLDQQPAVQPPDSLLDRWSSHETPGLVLFVETKRRMATLLGDKSLQSCQCHLLLSLYDAQLVRPIEAFDSVMHAANCSMLFWKNKTESEPTWLGDIQSRLYWIALVLESLLTDELSLPTSRLVEFQEQVPLPQFLRMDVPFLENLGDATLAETICHYHFLAQIAHRILINNVKNTLYWSDLAGRISAPPLEDELLFQLDQWRDQLPHPIKLGVDVNLPPAQFPHDIIVVPWLQIRYLAAKWHIGRPFLYEVLSRPEERPESDLQKCEKMLSDILNWEPSLQRIHMMRSCLPLKFNLGAQLLTQIVIFYCFKKVKDCLGRDVVPEGYHTWLTTAMHCIDTFASHSPTLRRDAQIALALYREMI